MKAHYVKHTLQFKFDAGTSRGILREKDTWFLFLWEENAPATVGIGECGPLKGLSLDDTPEFESKLLQVCQEVDVYMLHSAGPKYPSIQFGLECALLDLQQGGKKLIFPNDFYEKGSPIPINGLIWMGTKEFMLDQIKAKLDAGFTCLKLKVGALDFETEKEVLAFIRAHYSPQEITLRLDANGAFHPSEALTKLEQLSKFQIHSIEQPIQAGQIEHLASLCRSSPVPIALDEELIGISDPMEKRALLAAIQPAYIILKPTLVGGFRSSDEWIDTARTLGIGWWITSALESNVGLNAICQYTFEKTKGLAPFPQGLGTGSLYHNNIESPLLVKDGNISYQSEQSWGEVFP